MWVVLLQNFWVFGGRFLTEKGTETVKKAQILSREVLCYAFIIIGVRSKISSGDESLISMAHPLGRGIDPTPAPPL